MSDPRLSVKAKEAVDAKSGLKFSIVSLWEISIKINIGKLQLSCSFEGLMIRLAYIKAEILPLTVKDTQVYRSLPLSAEHRDPFDRMLVAQTLNRSLILVSSDEKFDFYPIQRMWV
jgi:PIN domain nuclease of toxin-antitoxin system